MRSTLRSNAIASAAAGTTELADLRSRLQSLTPREREVVALVATGQLNKQAAAAIGVSEVTVKLHRQNAMKKLGARSVPDLVRMADALGLRPNA